MHEYVNQAVHQNIEHPSIAIVFPLSTAGVLYSFKYFYIVLNTY